MEIVYTDGGRAEAGYKDYRRGDCGCRAAAIALNKAYKEIYKDMYSWFKVEIEGKMCKGPSHPRRGIFLSDMKDYMDSHNWIYVALPRTGRVCGVMINDPDLPMGRIILHVHRHFIAMIDHVVYDSFDSTKSGMEGIYGYFKERK